MPLHDKEVLLSEYYLLYHAEKNYDMLHHFKSLQVNL